jgi:hypothetical protein
VPSSWASWVATSWSVAEHRCSGHRGDPHPSEIATCGRLKVQYHVHDCQESQRKDKGGAWHHGEEHSSTSPARSGWQPWPASRCLLHGCSEECLRGEAERTRRTSGAVRRWGRPELSQEQSEWPWGREEEPSYPQSACGEAAPGGERGAAGGAAAGAGPCCPCESWGCCVSWSGGSTRPSEKTSCCSQGTGRRAASPQCAFEYGGSGAPNGGRPCRRAGTCKAWAARSTTQTTVRQEEAHWA